jgi:type IV secretion system protein VirB2
MSELGFQMVRMQRRLVLRGSRPAGRNHRESRRENPNMKGKSGNALLVAFVLSPAQVWAGGIGGSGLPWENPLWLVAKSLTGPVALSVSIIALMAAGGILVFGGELNEFARRSCIAVLAIAFLVAGSSFMATLFGVSGAVI